MKMLKRVRWVYLLLALFLIGMGVCLLIWPTVSMNLVCMITGGGAVLVGFAKIVVYGVRQVNAMIEQYDFAFGVLCVIGGVILLIQPEQLLELLPQVLACCILWDCVFKLQVALDAKRLGNGLWFLQLLAVLICVVWGVCLLVQPFGLKEKQYLGILVAGGLIADGVLNLLAVIYIAATVKKAPPVLNAPDLPNPLYAQEKATASAAAPKPQEDLPDPEESSVQVKDLIDNSREQTNSASGGGKIMNFFKRNQTDEGEN